MDNPNQYVDENTFRWTIAGIVGGAGAILGAIWKRLNGLEEKQTQSDDKLSDRQSEGDNALWTAVNGQGSDLTAFKVRTLETLRDVPTKADLAAMENRIMAALRNRVLAE